MPLWYEHTINPRSAVKYQEVLPNPTFGDTVTNMRPGEVGLASLWTVVGFATGYITGKPVRIQTGIFGAILCGVGGFIACHRVTFQRLKGFRENDRELAMYGIPKKKLVKVVRRRAVLSKEEIQDI